MKNNEIEAEIIRQFCVKNKQDRIIWELSNSKKRDKVIWRFAGIQLFKKECLKEVEYMSKKELEKYLYEKSKTLNVYYMGLDYLGPLKLEEAVERIEGDIGLIYCGNGIAYYQGEQNNTKPPRYLLENIANRYQVG